MDSDWLEISEHKGPEESPGLQLWRASMVWRRKIEDALAAHDLTHPQFVLLATIGWSLTAGPGLSQIELSRIVGLDANTVSQVVRGLEAKGLILREATKGRAKRLLLTDLGAVRVRETVPVVEAADAAFFGRLPDNGTAVAQQLAALVGE
ncbi:MarR family winged helix-turn-helix transcriptional regulator [Lacibacterium aquatile]|uniref:MarR family winged helix-turn-helix transcriptional regulator n=1 Tax=Lacibacterium aquatile TaxID=1168082 RepID=A0ABW5DVE0_9PROT